MRTTILLACLLAFSGRFVYSQEKSTDSHLESARAERYRLVDAQVESSNGTPHHELFLLDPQTGRVWRYQRGEIIEQGGQVTGSLPELFTPVEFVSLKDVGKSKSKDRPD